MIHMILPVEGPIRPFVNVVFLTINLLTAFELTLRSNWDTDWATAAGKVSLIGDFFNGRFIVIDHGEGLKTMYKHMIGSMLRGLVVEQSEPIGTVGSTGRSTGPHLHLGVILYGVYVDPNVLIPEIRSLPQ